MYSRVPACQITTFYYVGFAYMMMRRKYRNSKKKKKNSSGKTKKKLSRAYRQLQTNKIYKQCNTENNFGSYRQLTVVFFFLVVFLDKDVIYLTEL